MCQVILLMGEFVTRHTYFSEETMVISLIEKKKITKGEQTDIGSDPLCLGELSSLRPLEHSFNQLSGTFSEIHFANLSTLSIFYVCGTL